VPRSRVRVRRWRAEDLPGSVGRRADSEPPFGYARNVAVGPVHSGFAPGGVLAAADPNVECTAVADLDLASLAQARDAGCVRPLHDRRVDLYRLDSRTTVERVRVE